MYVGNYFNQNQIFKRAKNNTLTKIYDFLILKLLFRYIYRFTVHIILYNGFTSIKMEYENVSESFFKEIKIYLKYL